MNQYTDVATVLQSVRFVVGPTGRPTDALLSIEAWDTLVEWLEDVEDARTVREAMQRLEAAAGNPQRAGLIAWSDAEAELDALDQSTESAHGDGMD
jgi:hypothetical protein